MEVRVRDMRTGETETFNPATTEIREKTVVVTDQKGFEHFFPVGDVMVMSSPQPPPWWRRILPF